MNGLSNITEFNALGSIKPKRKRKLPPPFSLRLTHDEHNRLKRDAGKMQRSAYVREKLFGDDAAPRKPQASRKKRQPSMDAQTIARLLSTFGQSELAASMMAIAMAAQSGTLPVTPELENKLDKTCTDIDAMCRAMVYALGVQREGGK